MSAEIGIDDIPSLLTMSRWKPADLSPNYVLLIQRRRSGAANT